MEKNGNEVMRTGLSFIYHRMDLGNASLKSLHTLLNDTVSKRGTMIKMKHMRIRIWNLSISQILVIAFCLHLNC